MSVRNRYASNSTKIAPFPPSSRLIAEARVAVKNSDDIKRSHAKSNRFIVDKQRDLNRKTSDLVVVKTGTSNQLKKEEISKIHVKPNNPKSTPPVAVKAGKHVNGVSTSEALTSSKNDTTQQGVIKDDSRENERDQIYKLGKREMNIKSNNLAEVSENIGRRHSDSQYELQTGSSGFYRISDSLTSTKPIHGQNNKNNEHDDVAASPILRPKSARPASRWERRDGDDDSDEELVDETLNISRPKSARPESRLLRQSETEIQINEITPPRPTTSRGHHRKHDLTDNEQSNSQTNQQLLSFNDQGNSRKSKSSEVSSKSVPSNNKYKAQAFEISVHGYDPYSFRKEQIKVMKARDLLDLNSGVDDIDLDIDPVVYFMQDDDMTTSSHIKKSSLSKDAINIIGNVSSTALSKPPIGYQGNNQNKLRHKSEETQCYYRNEQSDMKTLARESNQFSIHNDRNVHKLGDSKQTSHKKSFRTRAYSDNYVANMSPPSGKYSTVSNKFITKYNKGLDSSEMEQSGHTYQFKKFGDLGGYLDDDIAFRKPRKLEPINRRYLPH